MKNIRTKQFRKLAASFGIRPGDGEISPFSPAFKQKSKPRKIPIDLMENSPFNTDSPSPSPSPSPISDEEFAKIKAKSTGEMEAERAGERYLEEGEMEAERANERYFEEGRNPAADDEMERNKELYDDGLNRNNGINDNIGTDMTGFDKNKIRDSNPGVYKAKRRNPKPLLDNNIPF